MNDEIYDAFLSEKLPTEKELRALFTPESKLIIFDIGACEGEDSIRYSHLFPEARIFSFEPLPSNQDLIRHHFARHKAVRCELVPLALSDRCGTADFFVSSGAPQEKTLGEEWNYGNKSNSLLPPGDFQKEQTPWLKFETKQTVQTDTLDNFCKSRKIDHIDFIHMDVQGAEWLVLQGAVHMVPHIKAIWLEVANKEVYRGQKIKKDIEELLGRAGFGITYELVRGVEGDQFYVNTRHCRVGPKVAINRMKRLGRSARGGLRRLMGK